MDNEFSRTELLIGSECLERLSHCRVLLFGVGGVGGFVAEALARSGVGSIDLVDNDTVSITNINRQIIALHSTIGMAKVDVMKSRILDINPACVVNTHRVFYTEETKDIFDFSQYDYVIDCIDTVSGKIQIVLEAQKAGIKVISSMGAGNKLNPTDFEVADIYKTSVCPLARVMRKALKERGVKKLKVVYSKEPPRKRRCAMVDENTNPAKSVPASIAFTPSVAGLIIASEVIKDVIA